MIPLFAHVLAGALLAAPSWASRQATARGGSPSSASADAATVGTTGVSLLPQFAESFSPSIGPAASPVLCALTHDPSLAQPALVSPANVSAVPVTPAPDEGAANMNGESPPVPLSDAWRIYRKNFAVPEFLIRVTYLKLEHLFRSDGFLASHAWYSSGGNYRSLARTAPMIHPEDLAVIKQLLRYAPQQELNVLLIDPQHVKHLTNADHPKLKKYGEYFGEIPREAVTSIIPLNQYVPGSDK